ncbi:hypothetical protein [Chitinilyticum litopenaei]|nr:hypothetical protein [Chitinilyticum litopenaei]
MPHQREYRMLNGEKRVAYLIAQSASEDLDSVRDGFALVLDSFSLR